MDVENVEEAVPVPTNDDAEMEHQKISPANEAQDKSNDEPMVNQETNPEQHVTTNNQEPPAATETDVVPTEVVEDNKEGQV